MTDYPQVTRLESVTILLPVVNETVSLRQSVEILLRGAKPDIRELLIIVCKKTTAASLAVIAQLQQELGDLVVVRHQTLPFLGGAMREAFELARGSHVIMMSSDLETDPAVVPEMIALERKNPSGIVTATRWRSQTGFEGYSKVKLFCNWIFQRFFSVLYGTPLTDMTYGFRIFPTKLVQAIQWDELRHPLLFETMVKPLRLGVPVKEISCVWRARTEGESQNTFFQNFAYFRTGFKNRFRSRRAMLRAAGAGATAAAVSQALPPKPS